MQAFAESFYKGRRWKKCRDGYFAYRLGICERCQAEGKIVHHKIELTPDNIHDPDIALNWDNLELLCQPCHNRETFGSGEGVTREDVMFDEYGNLVQRG